MNPEVSLEAIRGQVYGTALCSRAAHSIILPPLSQIRARLQKLRLICAAVIPDFWCIPEPLRMRPNMSGWNAKNYMRGCYAHDVHAYMRFPDPPPSLATSHAAMASGSAQMSTTHVRLSA